MQDSDSCGLKVCSLDALLVLVDGLLVRRRFWGRELKLLDGPGLRFGRREPQLLLEGLRLRLGRLRLRFGL